MSDKLREALEKIARWVDFPAVTGPDGQPSTYGIEYGSNGERDYMRKVAAEALATTRAAAPQGTEPVAVRWRHPGYRWVYEDHEPGRLYAGRVEVQRLVVQRSHSPRRDLAAPTEADRLDVERDALLEEARDALRCMQWSAVSNPSCQLGAVKRCSCRRCAGAFARAVLEKLDTAMSAQAGGKEQGS